MQGVSIREISIKTFLFQFFHSFDFAKVYNDGPWNFDGHLLLSHKMVAGEIPTTIPLHHALFWVQVHDLPMGCMALEVGKLMGNFVGELVEYDPKNSSDFWKSYMCIRVKLDVRVPLKRGKKIRLYNGVISQVRFKYERLTVFYFFCGMLGHSDTMCEKRFAMGVDNGERGWSVELQVERRRQGTTSSCR